MESSAGLIRALNSVTVAQGGGGKAIVQRAIEFIERADTRAQHVQVEGQQSVQDLLTKETLHVLRSEREHNLATEESHNDYAYIEVISTIPRMKNVGHMIALVARYAGELPHDLINPFMRRHFTTTANARNQPREQIQELKRAGVIQDSMTWEEYVDPGLAGNARIACHDIGQSLPRLNGIDVEDVLNMANQTTTKHTKTFIDYFCAVVAARWRANSVLAAQPYKTKNEQEAVMLALRESSKRLLDFTFDGKDINYSRRYPPTTLSELRGGATMPAFDQQYTGGVRPY